LVGCNPEIARGGAQALYNIDVGQKVEISHNMFSPLVDKSDLHLRVRA